MCGNDLAGSVLCVCEFVKVMCLAEGLAKKVLHYQHGK